MNNDLLAIYGEAQIHEGCLEVKLLKLAHSLTDWNIQVHTVLNKYKQHLQKVELPILIHQLKENVKLRQFNGSH